MEVRQSKKKAEALRSSATAVTGALRDLERPEALELYRQIEARKQATVLAAVRHERAAAEVTARHSEAAAKQRTLRTVVVACAGLGPIAGIEGADTFGAFELGDDVALAERLAAALAGKCGIAAELRKLLVRARRDHRASQLLLVNAVAARSSAQLELAAEAFSLQGALAIGRSVLAGNGVHVAERRSARRKRGTPASRAPQPAPATPDQEVSSAA